MRPNSLNRRPAPAASRLLVACVAILVCVPMVAQVFMPARRVVPFLSSAEPLSPPLDIVTNLPWSAYSVTRRLSTAWAGSAYEVHRISDATEQDIGFTASGAVDTNALMTFLGTTNGYTSVIYDQSGNGRHLNAYSNITNTVMVASNGIVVVDHKGRQTGFVRGLVNTTHISASATTAALSNTLFLVTVPLISKSMAAADATLVNLGGSEQGSISLNGVRFDGVNQIALGTGVTSAPVVLGRQYHSTALFRSNNTDVVQVNFDATDNTSAGAAGELHSSNPIIGQNAASPSAAQFFSEWIYYNQEADTNTWAILANNMTNYYAISYPTGIAVTNSAFFDGSNDYMAMTSSGPTGLADGKQITFSGWVNFFGGDGSDQRILWFGNAGSTRFSVRKTTGNAISFLGVNSTPTTILNVESTGTLTSSSGWTHVYGCFDLANTSLRKIYINGVSQTLTVTTYTDDTMDLVGVGYTYLGGASSGPANRLNGAAAEIWFDDSYLDNVSAFYNAGQPVNLGSSGSVPTGASPVFYFRGYGQGFGVNSGTGGNFTVTGSLGAMWPPGVTP